MTVPTGPASLLDIQNEFGGSGTIGLDEYYAGGSYVSNPAPTSGSQTGPVPTSGAISIGNFLGLNKNFVFNDVVTSDMAGYNLQTRAVAAGWNGAVPLIATITIDPGVTVYGANTSSYGMTINSLPSGSSVILYNHGTISGRGGTGGVGGLASGASASGGASGGAGGPGLLVSYPTTLYNYGTIGGGGGGGGGGGAAFAYDGKSVLFVSSGAGGGGGQPFGIAGSGGNATGGGGGAGSNEFGNDGSAGTEGLYGSGGASRGTGDPDGGAGGRGGLIGQPGAPGSSGSGTGGAAGGAAGGATGAAIVGGANITWVASYGLVLGSIDNWGSYGGTGSNYESLMDGYTSPPIGTFGLDPDDWTTAMGNTWYWNNLNAQSSGNVVNIPFAAMYVNTSGSNVTARLFGSVDNSLTAMEINGTAIAPGTTMGYGATYSSNTFTLVPGANHIAFIAQNQGGPAGAAIQLRNLANNVLIPLNGWHYDASGVTPYSAGGGGGGGGGGSVSVFAYLPPELKQAGQIVQGDSIVLLGEDRQSTKMGTVVSNRVSTQNLLTLVSESGIRLTMSDNTPLTLEDGSSINSTEALGVRLPVQDENGFRWEEIVDVIDAGRGEVATIYVQDQCYAAGDEPGRWMFTHNALNQKN